MTKTELLTALADKTGVSKVDTDKILKALTEVIHEQVAKGEEIALPDLGKFVRTERSARNGRNPATGEVIKIAARKAPGFKAAKSFKDIVNK